MTPALHVRIASKLDADVIAAMSRDLIEHGLPWSWRSERVTRAIEADNTNVVVLRDQTELDAFGIMEYWDDDAHLVLFAVRPAFRRRGIGGALLHWLEVSAQAAGSQRIRVEARRENVAARNFYNDHGYHEFAIRSRMYSGVVDGIQLAKYLRPSAPSDV